MSASSITPAADQVYVSGCLASGASDTRIVGARVAFGR
jgi:hypothetical protein